MRDPRNPWADALLSGLAGAVVLNVVHETARHTLPNAPSMDTYGRRAIARGLEAAGVEPPGYAGLQAAALGGDLVSNTLYYALVGLGPRPGALARGAALGAAAGLGAVVLPPVMGLGSRPSRATPQTKAMAFSWYLLGGLAAAAAFSALSGRRRA